MNAFHKSLLRLEKLVDRMTPDRKVSEETAVQCYYGYGNGDRAVVRGRVLQEPRLRESNLDDSRRRNFLTISSQFFTREVPYARLCGHVRDTVFEMECDEEGYFEYEFTLKTPVDEDVLWIDYAVHLMDDEGDLDKKSFHGKIQMLPASAQRLIISDIDDTVIETGAARLWDLLKNTLLENVHTRQVFEGISEFYRKLQDGNSGEDQNPLFYVTSSPYNLREFLLKVFELRDTPHGPAFMTDWGIDETKILKHGHGAHKLNAIRNLLEFYPNQPAILIGDSGEKDPEIYTKIVQQFPDRVQAIYIRDVSEYTRDKEVHALASICAEHHVPLLLTEYTQEAMDDAERLEFLSL